MNKEEYMSIRWKSDFLRYSLLQNDSLSAQEIANQLYGTIDFTDLLHRCKQKVEILLAGYLSFDKLKKDGKLSNVLTDELPLGLHHSLVEEFRTFLDEISVHRQAELQTEAVVNRIERVAWNNGIGEMRSALKLFKQKVSDASNSYAGMCVDTMSEADIARLYEEAKEQTLMERLQGNNIDDIIEYRNALMDYVQATCETMQYDFFAQVLKEVHGAVIFGKLCDNFEEMERYAQTLSESLPEKMEPNAEWDAQYNRYVPTEFYCRNVEHITSEQAFHMVLLQFFARNEEWMVEQGMLRDGELCVYTHPQQSAMASLLARLQTMV